MHVAGFSSARPGRANEDFAAWDDHVVVVLDGAGMPDELSPPCIHGVSWFVRTLGSALCSEGAGSRPLPDCLGSAIDQTAGLHRDTCSVDDPLSPSATLAMLRVRGDTVEWLVLGDCTVVIDDGCSVEAISDNRLASVALKERVAMEGALPGSAERRRRHARLVKAERTLRNRPGGYWVAAADPQAAYVALHGSRPKAEVARAALLTDGAARLTASFALTDWPGCLDILEVHGPEQLIGRVRAAELNDTALTRWPRGKLHDDATAVYVRP